MPPGELAAFVVAAGSAALAASILVYAGASFVLMRTHVRQRSLVRHTTEALREIAWAALIQPLVPLFYLFGRRMAGGTGTPIVMVHGYMQNRADFIRIVRACARAGLGPVYGFNYPWFATVHGNAERLARFCDAVRSETGASCIDLVAHSLGGLVATEYLHDAGPSKVRRVVTIASPHGGVAWRGPIIGACGPQVRQGCDFVVARATRALAVPCLSIYSTHDNVVHPPETSMLAPRGARDHAIEHAGHLAILFDPHTAQTVVDFLKAPDEAVERTVVSAPLQPAPELSGT